MAGRKPLGLTLALFGAVAGCATTGGGGPGTSPVPYAAQSAAGLPPITPDVPIIKEPQLPKKPPKAATCVAYGDFRAKEAVHPDYPPLVRQQYYEQARKAYQQALEIDPNCTAAHQGLARLYASFNDMSRAVSTYEQGLKQASKDGGLWYELGMLHNRMKQPDKALECLTKALACEPERRQYQHMVGYTLARAGRFDEAFAHFAKTDGEAAAHYNLARMAYQLKHDDLCRDHLARALALDPNLKDALVFRAEVEGRTAVASQPSADVMIGPPAIQQTAYTPEPEPEWKPAPKPRRPVAQLPPLPSR